MLRRALIVVFITVGTAHAAHAQQQTCEPRDEIVALLASKYKETRRMYGLMNDTTMLELFASEKGTWTALRSTVDGKSCVVASGQSWTTQAPQILGQDV